MKRFFPGLLLAGILAAGSTGRAATILNLDFGYTTLQPTDNFQGYNANNGSASYTPTTGGFSTGSITVTTSGAPLNDVRSPAAPGPSVAPLTGPYTDFYEGWIGNATTDAMTLSLAGLADNQEYTFTLQAYDIDVSTTAAIDSATVTDTTAGGLGGIATAFSNTTFDPSVNLSSNSGESPAVLDVRSSATGTLSFSIQSATGGTHVNGFELAVAPEPPAAWLILLGLLGLSRWPRRVAILYAA